MASILTGDKIQQHLEKQADVNKRGSLPALIIMLAFGVAIFYIGTQADPKWFSVVLCLTGIVMILLFFLGLIGRSRMIKEYREGKHLQFWITKSICISKHCRSISTDSDTTDYYFFVLEGYGKFKMSSDSCILDGISNYYQYEQDLYDRTVPGDIFYLVFTEGSGAAARMIIPASEWELSPTGFVERDGKILPTS